MPVCVLVLSLVVRPLHARQSTQRALSGRLTALGADTVAGPAGAARARRRARLRRPVPRALARRCCRGGRGRGARAGRARGAAGAAARACSPRPSCGWAPAPRSRAASARATSSTFYGVSAFLSAAAHRRRGGREVGPGLRRRPARRHGAADRAARRSRATTSGAAPPSDGPGAMHDPDSGVVLRPGELTAIVSRDPADAARVAARLGRDDDSTRAELDGVPLTGLPLRDVRRRVVLSEAEPSLFSGPLRETLDPGRSRSTAQVLAALDVASALRRRSPRCPAGWPGGCPSAAGRCPAGSGSASAWPGRCCATPTSCCSSSRRARSTPTPRPASPSGSGRPGRADDGRRHREPAAARARRPGAVPRRRPGRRRGRPPRPARARAGLPRHRDPGGGRMSGSPLLRDAPGATRRSLPVADLPVVRREAAALLRAHRRGLARVVALYAVASVAALAAPLLLGRLVDGVASGTLRTGRRRPDGGAAAGRGGCPGPVRVAVPAVLRRARRAGLRPAAGGLRRPGRRAAAVHGGDRRHRRPGVPDHERRGDAVVDGPDGRAQRARRLDRDRGDPGGGRPVRPARGPRGRWSALPLVWPATRWYLRRAPRGYVAERDAYARLNGGVTETVESAVTVERLGLGPVRVARTDADLRRAWAVERYTLALRLRWFPALELGYQLPLAVALLWGGFLVTQDLATRRPGDGGDAVPAPAHRPARRAAHLVRPPPGRGGLLRAGRRDRDGAGRPDRHRRRARRHRGVRPRRPVRLRHRPGRHPARRAPRPRPRPAARRAPRRRRAVRRGQVHPGPPPRRRAPAPDRARERGRRPARRPAPARAAPPGRAGHPGAPRLRRHARGEPAARPARTPTGPSWRTRWPRWTRSAGRGAAATAWTPRSARGPSRSTTGRRSSSPWPGSSSPTRTRSCSTRRRRCWTRGPPGTSSARCRPCSPGAPWSPSPTGCTPPTTPTGSRSSRTAGSVELGSHDELIARDGSYAALWRSWQVDPVPSART